MTEDMLTLIVLIDDETRTLHAAHGANLRQTLLDAGISPYGSISKRLNCGGKGICATCGVLIADDNEPQPTHWHDKLAKRFGYPRLSCQIVIDRPLTIRIITDKRMWE